ncbi:MAG: hypothetical protein R3F11_16180 [Verrucomicrobiales bacterium]
MPEASDKTMRADPSADSPSRDEGKAATTSARKAARLTSAPTTCGGSERQYKKFAPLP